MFSQTEIKRRYKFPKQKEDVAIDPIYNKHNKNIKNLLSTNLITQIKRISSLRDTIYKTSYKEKQII